MHQVYEFLSNIKRFCHNCYFVILNLFQCYITFGFHSLFAAGVDAETSSDFLTFLTTSQIMLKSPKGEGDYWKDFKYHGWDLALPLPYLTVFAYRLFKQLN